MKPLHNKLIERELYLEYRSSRSGNKENTNWIHAVTTETQLLISMIFKANLRVMETSVIYKGKKIRKKTNTDYEWKKTYEEWLRVCVRLSCFYSRVEKSGSTFACTVPVEGSHQKHLWLLQMHTKFILQLLTCSEQLLLLRPHTFVTLSAPLICAIAVSHSAKASSVFDNRRLSARGWVALGCQLWISEGSTVY